MLKRLTPLLVMMSVDPNWGAYIPGNVIYKIGLLTDIPSDIKEETIMRGLRGEQRDLIVGFSQVYKSIRTNSGIRDFPSFEVKVICKVEIPKYLMNYGFFPIC